MKYKLFILCLILLGVGILASSPINACDNQIKCDNYGQIVGPCESNGSCLNAGEYMDVNCSSGYASSYNCTITHCHTIFEGPQSFPMRDYIPYTYQNKDN